MNQHLTGAAVMALGLALLALPAVGAAQAPAAAQAPDQTQPQPQPAPATPSRQANTWDWRHHQPTEAGVEQNEQAAGVASSPARQQSSAAAVDHLDRQLLRRH